MTHIANEYVLGEPHGSRPDIIMLVLNGQVSWLAGWLVGWLRVVDVSVMSFLSLSRGSVCTFVLTMHHGMRACMHLRITRVTRLASLTQSLT
jgi:hypothetical protein